MTSTALRERSIDGTPAVLAAVTAAVGLVAVSVVVTWIGMFSLVAAAGVCYAVTYMAVAYRWPVVGLTLVFATMLFTNDLSSGGPVRFSLAEVNLFLFVLVHFWRSWQYNRQLLPLGPLAIPMLFWFGTSVCSTLLHWRGPVAVVSIVQMMLYLIVSVVVFGFGVEDRRQLRTCLYSLVCIAVVLGLRALTSPPGSYVFGLQKNGVGASLSAAVVICTELWLSEPPGRRRTWLLRALAVLVGGMVCTLSRGAWMAAITGLVVVLLARGQVQRLLRLALAFVPLVAVCWVFLPAEQRDYATSFDAGHENIRLRYVAFAYAKSLYDQSPLIGMGVGLRKQYDATNIVMLTLAETGLIGLALFAFYHAVFLLAVWRARWSVPQSDPRFTLLVLGAALVLGKLMHGMVDHYWGRGALGISWAAGGMAWGVVMATRASPTVRPSGS